MTILVDAVCGVIFLNTCGNQVLGEVKRVFFVAVV